MEVDQAPSFHPAKRRKFMRKRQTESPTRSPTGEADEGLRDIRSQSPVKSPEADSGAPEDGEPTPAMSEVLRFRKSHKQRRGGIGFSAGNKPSSSGGEGNQASTELSLAEQEDDEGRALGMDTRFTGHTGQKVDVDKHMMAYIESELAKRQVPGRPEAAGTETATGHDDNGEALGDWGATSQRGSSEAKALQRQPATLGKLHEIDLGPDSKMRNIVRTEAATRRLADGDKSPVPGEDEDDGGTKKTRGEKEEKAGRGRRRRNSEDVRRDQLVEEVLRESKLDVYQEPVTEKTTDDGQAADDRIAEQFRRDFLDAIQSRRRGARARKETTKSGSGKTEAPRGPKLGGSRSARAAMREKQNKEAQQKK